MKASLAQRKDYQVKCDKSIQFGATKRETEAKTKTMTSATANPTEKANEDSWSAELFPRIEAEPIPKSRTLIADRTPAKKPILWKREGEALTSPGNPLTNLTTIKLSRKKVRKLQAERVWKVCFARFLQSSIYPPWPNP